MKQSASGISFCMALGLGIVVFLIRITAYPWLPPQTAIRHTLEEAIALRNELVAVGYLVSDVIEVGMTKIYAGIGSRRTPMDICELMQELAVKLATKGAILRSGGAEGADLAFETGCDRIDGEKQIFSTHHYFDETRGCVGSIQKVYLPSYWTKATEIASLYHPRWRYLTPYAQHLHARNCFQVLGINLKLPAHFVICWTPDGARTKDETSPSTGGTGQAIRLASAYGIRVYNLAVAEDMVLAQSWLSADKVNVSGK